MRDDILTRFTELRWYRGTHDERPAMTDSSRGRPVTITPVTRERGDREPHRQASCLCSMIHELHNQAARPRSATTSTRRPYAELHVQSSAKRIVVFHWQISVVQLLNLVVETRQRAWEHD
ncbi:hypothetical protein LSAT2_006725, partial [Lamellibrachia satsuma]